MPVLLRVLYNPYNFDERIRTPQMERRVPVLAVDLAEPTNKVKTEYLYINTKKKV